MVASTEDMTGMESNCTVAHQGLWVLLLENNSAVALSFAFAAPRDRSQGNWSGIPPCIRITREIYSLSLQEHRSLILIVHRFFFSYNTLSTISLPQLFPVLPHLPTYSSPYPCLHSLTRKQIENFKKEEFIIIK